MILMTLNIELLLVSLFAAFFVGVVKGGFGGIMALLGVPIVTLATSPQQALAIMLPLMCVMDTVAIMRYWRKWEIKSLRALVPSALGGIGVGSYFVNILSGAYLRLFIAMVAFQFCLKHFLTHGSNHPSPQRNKEKTTTLVATAWGFISGLSSVLAHAGGPALNAYLLPQHLPKTRYQSTVNAYYIIINYSKILPYALLGLFTSETLMICLLSIPIAIIGTYVGVWLHYRISQTTFYRIAYIAFFCSGCKLTYDALSELI